MTPDKMTLSQIADLLGAADAERKAAEARVGALKAELRKRRAESAVGTRFVVDVNEVDMVVLDQAAVKEFLGDDLPEFQKVTSSTRFVIRALAQFEKEAA